MNKKSFNREQLVLQHPIPVSLEGTEKILFQMKNCICKIFQKNGYIGTGFFCKIPFNNIFLPVLITNNHILDDKDLNIYNIIELSINGKTKIKITIDDSRITYTKKEDDITIIEIKPEDGIKYYLEIDDDLNNEILESEYRNKSIYILHYPKEDLSVSYGVIKKIKDKKTIIHLCSTEEGSSGSPILLLKTFKIIGIHCGFHKNNNKCNYGTFIQYLIIKFNKNYYNKETKIILNNSLINNNSNNITKNNQDFYMNLSNNFNNNNPNINMNSNLKNNQNINMNLNNNINNNAYNNQLNISMNNTLEIDVIYKIYIYLIYQIKNSQNFVQNLMVKIIHFI